MDHAEKLDTRPEHFHPSLAVVLCKGVFDDATDQELIGSSKAPASKSGTTTQPLAAAQGVQEHMQSILFGAATLAQAMGTEEDAVRHLENYTGLLVGLQDLVIIMASGYEAATEDIQALVASTLDVATQHDRAFVAGDSQALANWMEKYQQAMSQGENQSLHDQLAHWDQVRKA